MGNICLVLLLKKQFKYCLAVWLLNNYSDPRCKQRVRNGTKVQWFVSLIIILQRNIPYYHDSLSATQLFVEEPLPCLTIWCSWWLADITFNAPIHNVSLKIKNYFKTRNMIGRTNLNNKFASGNFSKYGFNWT